MSIAFLHCSTMSEAAPPSCAITWAGVTGGSPEPKPSPRPEAPGPWALHPRPAALTCAMKLRATLSSEVHEETDHHVITLPGSYSSYLLRGVARKGEGCGEGKGVVARLRACLWLGEGAQVGGDAAPQRDGLVEGHATHRLEEEAQVAQVPRHLPRPEELRRAQASSGELRRAQASSGEAT